ncbi:prostaglandin G/H synthase 1 isoform X2 [Halyomorpha halys]|uniref:prostaglandin G/H synthase 1 isoform X2 n=1 Tax=Halyomorpha halys TaxID=286706 RepID=UPI0006D4D73F|nr:prostaglandin G/H synthase 1 isoform X2 [Halyomorpha halys]
MRLNLLQSKTLCILFIIIFLQHTIISSAQLLSKKKKNEGCCSFPCQHGGICIERKCGYFCDCKNTGYYGKNCAIETWITFFRCNINKILEVVISIHCFIFSFLNSNLVYFPSYYKITGEIPCKVHTVGIYGIDGKSYAALSPLYNHHSAVRITPSVPQYCPTPLGTKGKKSFDPVPEVYSMLLKRQSFNASKSTNLLFTIYGFHFFLQFLSHGNLHGLTCSQLYAEHIRSHHKGKLITEVHGGEEFPTYHLPSQKKTFANYLERTEQADWKATILKQNFLTYIIATIWVKEHNRVCDILAKLWPSWDDDRLFDTAKNIVTGELLVITLSEWYPVFMGYKTNLFYDPSYSATEYSLISNRLPIETFLALYWPNLVPDSFTVNNYTTAITEYLWNNPDDSLVKKFGLYSLVEALAVSPSGQVSMQNTMDILSETTKYVIEMGRKLRIPSFNRMRAIVGLKPYNTFTDMMKTTKWNSILEKTYGNVDNIEFILGETVTNLFGPWLLKALLTHPLGSKFMWKPSTMGGKVGWNIVNNAKLKNLVCYNVKSPEICIKKNLISFKLKPERRKRASIERSKRQKNNIIKRNTKE